MTWPITIYANNNGAIAISTNNKNHCHTKHIDMQHHFVKERTKVDKINFKYILSTSNMADFLMKPLLRDVIQRTITILDLGPQNLGAAVQGEYWIELQHPKAMTSPSFLHSWYLFKSPTLPATPLHIILAYYKYPTNFHIYSTSCNSLVVITPTTVTPKDILLISVTMWQI